jgi:hypothetical protein
VSGGRWFIQLLGEFRLVTPDGVEVSIPSRKSRALIAQLALADGLAIKRETLGRDLWPDKPQLNQQQSLRQAIKSVKESLEPYHLLEADRETCRLRSELYVCDALECLLLGKDPGKAVLLPEMPEPVFEGYRVELAALSPSGELGEAIRGACAVLEWANQHDPARSLDMLYSFRELMPSMPQQFVRSFLQIQLSRSDSPAKLRRWAQTQLAIAMMWMGLHEEGLEAAKASLDTTHPKEDAQDWLNAVSSAAFLLTVRGKFAKVDRLLEGALEMARQHGLEEAEVRVQHAEALKWVYEGKLDRAIGLLEGLSGTGVGSVAWTLREIHRVCAYAIANNPREGRETFESVKAQGSGFDNALINSQLKVAEGYTLWREGSELAARDQFEELEQYASNLSLHLIHIHAVEGRALTAENSEARDAHLRRAHDLRARFRFPLLPGDRMRLASLEPPSMEAPQG